MATLKKTAKNAVPAKVIEKKIAPKQPKKSKISTINEVASKKIVVSEKISKKPVKAEQVSATIPKAATESKKDQAVASDGFKIILATLFSLIFIVSFVANGFLYYSFVKEKKTVKDDITSSQNKINEVEAKLNNLSIGLDTLSKNQPNAPTPTPTTLQISKPTATSDRWRGPSEARFVWVSYTDFLCPFCSKIHPSLSQINVDFPDVAVVYRNYPLTAIHPTAIKLAEGAECVAKLNGNDSYWKFTDKIFENQQTITPQQLPALATSLGLNGENVKSCMDNNELTSKVAGDSETSGKLLGAAGLGTPTSVIYDTKTDKNLVISGALPYEQLKQSLQDFISKNK